MNKDKRAGDNGMTSLNGSGMVAKSDERIALIGAVDELNCHIGIIKAEASCSHLTAVLERIQKSLLRINDGVRIRYAKEAIPAPEEIAFLEQEIEYLITENDGAAAQLPGENRESAVFFLAAAIARRAERALIAVDRRYGVRAESRQYLNRLAEYFDQAALYRCTHPSENASGENASGIMAGAVVPKQRMQQVVRQVISEMGVAHEINLEQAKLLIEAVEREAAERGSSAVICVCNAHGNPVAVHVMDGAFLVSFDAAQKKAYTAAAVKMPTIELAKLAAPGQTFYGVDRLGDGKITLIGGGRPLLRDGVLMGAVGVSGGTGEEDDSLASYAADIYDSM